MEKVTSHDGTSIAYDRMGSGPALILVDAALGFRAAGPMPALAAALASDFTVYTYDRRGRGDSTDTLPYTVQREIDDLAALIAAAGGTAAVHGFSSGAVLTLHAAASGLPISSLSLLEPPLSLEDSTEPDPLVAETAALIAAGRRGDALERFHLAIGVPETMVADMRAAPSWPALESVAHTLLYDTEITSTFRAGQLATITTPTLVLNSDATDDRLKAWAQAAATHIPNATHQSLPGEWHGIAPNVLAPALVTFHSRLAEG